MPEVELTWKRMISVWWLITWRSGVGAVLLGGLAGFMIGLFGAIAGISDAASQMMATLAGAALGTVWAVFVVRSAFTKRFGDFRLALVPVQA